MPRRRGLAAPTFPSKSDSQQLSQRSFGEGQLVHAHHQCTGVSKGSPKIHFSIDLQNCLQRAVFSFFQLQSEPIAFKDWISAWCKNRLLLFSSRKLDAPPPLLPLPSPPTVTNRAAIAATPTKNPRPRFLPLAVADQPRPETKHGPPSPCRLRRASQQPWLAA